MSSIWRRMRDINWDRNWQSVDEFVLFKVYEFYFAYLSLLVENLQVNTIRVF